MKAVHCFLGACVAVATILPAHAQTKAAIGYTATIDVTPLFVAAEKGFFQKHGLDAVLQLMSVNSVIPPALVSDSIQIGLPTATTFLQAADAGIDLVGLSGLNFTRANDVNFGVVARTGSAIMKPQDFVGKKVGVPGLNAFLHVMFREWLRTNGVDPRQVTFVETAFPQMNEIMKAGSIDAAITAEPFQGRIIKAGTGTMLAYFTRELPPGLPIVFFTSTRKWAAANPQAVKALREGMAEGMTYTHANIEEARAIAAKNLKLPIEVVSSVEMPPFQVEIASAALGRWVEIMKSQDMLTRTINADTLVMR